MKVNQDLLNAIEKYLRGEASAEERALVNQWYHSFSDEQVNIPAATGFDKEEIFDRIQGNLQELVQQPAPSRGKVRRLWLKRTAVAAGVALVLGAGLWWLRISKNAAPSQLAATQTPSPVMPGSNKAILVLDDGSTMTLNDSLQAAIGNAQVNGKSLVYTPENNQNSAIQYNTLKTPQGGQFAVVLPDGSKAWLNAASSLKYPTSFNGQQRTVELSGEAYFEIAPDQNKPFIVQVNNMKVQVLGTSFNIMAYPEEKSIKTTLITGAVNVTNGHASKQLSPGQQAASDSSQQLTITQADVNAVIAWKEGKFEFTGEAIDVALRQLARWYDLQLQFEDGIPEEHLSAVFPRNTSLENIIRMLELSGIHCKLNDRRLIVSRN
ncbi:FecR domain-containing protein [Chitinophaga sp. HK235]|uniref:FecR domain-containing protein n=1 Tax=Chitinophaga sp. HK235 TaxID=2952571 RepID=UPI001BA8F208|nr:FecR domain-containing protein [Chitinophaga sp. HK235]